MPNSRSDSTTPGNLAVVATPLGNLGDITLRALEALRHADHIVAEDTRRTKILLNHYEIRPKRLTAFHQHSPPVVLNELVNELVAGQKLALVSDAGTPTISDPGRELILAALASGAVVDALPGPSAVTLAVTLSAFSDHGYRFVGFLPRRGKERTAEVERIAHDPLPTVFFESPQRVRGTLEELIPALGSQRPVVVCRELTKIHQEVARGPLGDIARTLPATSRGEITVVVCGCDARAAKPAADAASSSAIDELIAKHIAAQRGASISDRDIARELSQVFNLSKRDAYQRVLRTK